MTSPARDIASADRSGASAGDAGSAVEGALRGRSRAATRAPSEAVRHGVVRRRGRLLPLVLRPAPAGDRPLTRPGTLRVSQLLRRIGQPARIAGGRPWPGLHRPAHRA